MTPRTGHALVSCQMAVERLLGCTLSPEQVQELARLLSERARKLRLTPADYAARWSDSLRGEAMAVAGRFTIGESFFFRDLSQLSLCRDIILERLEAKPHHTLRILSAGCSTGEEPYSLLMLLLERLPADASIELLAMDISALALEKAQAGCYSAWALRETPSQYRERFFEHDGRNYRLSRRITQRVRFVRASLCLPAGELARQTYDAILCRNVLMYFTPTEYQRAASRLVDALVPGGSLYLGHAESLRGLGLPASLVRGSESFRYVKRAPAGAVDSDGLSAARPSPWLPAQQAFLPAAAQVLDSGGRESSTRLVRQEPASVAPGSEAAVAPTHASLTLGLQELPRVSELLAEERFTDALKALEENEHLSDPVVRLCRALLHVYTNAVDAAREGATTLLTNDEVNAGAYYALGLCHELGANWQGARECGLMATYLDPTFAMAWLHLGMSSKRLGNDATARRELMHARALLTVEHPARLLWFGGGCSRTALVAACRRELPAEGVRQ